jgi:enoyl-CoA hydratase/carnithine racemase
MNSSFATIPASPAAAKVKAMNKETTTGKAVAGISLQMDGGLATLTMDLPQPKNSFRSGNAQALGALLDEAVSAGARCVVLRGAGPVFSAGWDIGAIDPAVDDPTALLGEVVGPLCRKLRALPVPTLAAVAGPALGFGFGLALCCDLVLADESAVFGSPFRHIGMLPDSGTHHHMLGRVGYGKACELIYTGRMVSGSEAAALGLVNRVVPQGALIDEANQLAAVVASGPTRAFALSKEILSAGGDFDAMFAHEARQLQKVFATRDLKEGIAAFQQRRKPVFTGE